MRCPSCDGAVATAVGYPAWCECGWGLAPPAVLRPPRTAVERAYAAAGRRAGERAHRRLALAAALEPRLTPSLALAYAVAGLVHLLCLALLLGGAAALWLGAPRPMPMLLGGLMVAAAVLMRPRIAKPPRERLLDRAQAPALWALVDDVAAALHTPPPDRIVVEARFNAHWWRAGLRRIRVLGVGLPLLAVLPPDQRVALVAHELAHGRNGDVTRGWFIGSAIDGLGELAGLLTPARTPEHEHMEALEWATTVLQRMLRLPVEGMLAAELHLLMHDSRRAEYLADALAADVAGTDAAIALGESTLLATVVDGPVRRRAVAGGRDASGLLAEACAAVGAVPDRERERRRRVARLEDTRLLDSHPPTGLRIALLSRRAHRSPRVVLGHAASAAIDAELAGLVPEVERELLDACAGTLYAR
jgi:Zn-dependent protease with chaperone function